MLPELLEHLETQVIQECQKIQCLLSSRFEPWDLEVLVHLKTQLGRQVLLVQENRYFL